MKGRSMRGALLAGKGRNAPIGPMSSCVGDNYYCITNRNDVDETGCNVHRENEAYFSNFK